MPRSNRPRGPRSGGADDEAYDISRALFGSLRTESRRDGLWNVQSISAASASKTYTCPGCGLDIAPGTAHLVAWRADGLMGEAEDLAARRHWHLHCWKIK
ncbi:hypothetical protein F1C58_10930 [Glaciihabitans sp. INWT7]|uniref:hypothetical protein n=1 Tax=Glaciihabitans sp. INWT7 TaxID=2596912 RepID=UPI0016248671|nr:hypothetical protein [Glaciihabitans sp. INWT7]QNE47360.1 hypothetical protein F1C58_10930 [Glaciihabitans sp. INWT7]